MSTSTKEDRQATAADDASRQICPEIGWYAITAEGTDLLAEHDL